MPEYGLLFSALQPDTGSVGLVAYCQGEPRYQRDLDLLARKWRTTFALAPGSRYVLHSNDAFEFLAALIGAWHAGKCVLVPTDLQAAAVSQLGVAVDGVAGVPGGLTAGQPSDADWQPLDPEAMLLEMFTSGSTGHPVSIPKCLRQLDREVCALAQVLDPGPSAARVLGTVSHQHMYGLMFRILLPLSTGRAFESMRLPMMQDLAKVSAPEGCVLVSSPAHLGRLPELADVHCRVWTALSAGGPLDEGAVVACCKVLDVAPTEIYGSSETGAVAWRQRIRDVESEWKPLPGVEFKREDGLLHIRTGQLPTLDWFRSADRVVETPTGFQIAGRSDRIVKIEEKRLSLDAVERLALSSGLLVKARALVLQGEREVLAVAAMPNAAGWALAEAGKLRLVDALRDHLRSAAELEVLPRSWRFMDPWPATSDGKSPESLFHARFDRRNPEFRLLSRGVDGCVAELWVSPTAPFFAGHFPGQPVLPGVAQIDWMVWLCGELLGVRSDFAGLEAAKFRRVIKPASRLHVHLTNNAAGTRTNYRIEHQEQICASGRICWKLPA